MTIDLEMQGGQSQHEVTKLMFCFFLQVSSLLSAGTSYKDHMSWAKILTNDLTEESLRIS